MAYSQDIKNQKPRFTPVTLVAGVSPEIDLEGGTLDGILLEADVTSTSFTIQVARVSGGTFVTQKDGTAAGADRTWTLASTATGYYDISPIVTAGYRYCKIAFSQSETPTIYISKRNFN